MKYALGRLGFYAVAAWVSLTVNFFLPRLMPGDAASAVMTRFQGKLDPEALDAIREAYGITDAPLIVQYFDYLEAVVRLDLGISITYFPAPVSSVIAGGLFWTLLLAGVGVVVSFTIGTALGVYGTWHRGGLIDSIMPPTLAFLSAFPYFWLSMVALFVLGYQLELFPLRHAYSDALTPEFSWLFISDVIAHAFLPVVSIILASLAGWMLSMRNTMVTVLGTEYVTMARAKGLAPSRVMLRYAARNALLPNITGFGMALGFVLGGSLLTEIVFAYPGQGYLLIQAVRNQDYPLMQGLFLLITLAVLLANWMVDLVYLWLDPRTRTG